MPHLFRICGTAFCLAIGLAGCGEQQVAVGPPEESNNQMPVGPADPCGAGRLQAMVGENAGAADSANYPGESRILYPGMSGGPAFVQNRVTVRVDGENRITSVACG